jgi:hypothetical protein
MSFLRLEPTDIVISADEIVTPAWSNNAPTLESFFLSPLAEDNNEFFVNIFNLPSSSIDAELQFSIAYGNANGSGSTLFNAGVNGQSPTRVTYGQYRTLIYGDENKNFNFGISQEETEFFIINLNRERYKQHLLPGSLTLNLTNASGTITLTDNSRETTVNEYIDGGRVFHLVSGSSGSVNPVLDENCNCNAGTTASGSYGLLLPDIGIIVLNIRALSLPTISGGLGVVVTKSSNFADNNAQNVLFPLISSGSFFSILSEETVSSNYLFVRVPNQEFNYTLNPSIINSSGELLYSNFIQNPQTYITTVGLYNDNNELLAVGKMSKPLVKDFTKEALIRVKLNW